MVKKAKAQNREERKLADDDLRELDRGHMDESIHLHGIASNRMGRQRYLLRKGLGNQTERGPRGGGKIYRRGYLPKMTAKDTFKEPKISAGRNHELGDSMRPRAEENCQETGNEVDDTLAE